MAAFPPTVRKLFFRLNVLGLGVLAVVFAIEATAQPVWTQRAPSTSPSPRANAAMAYDAARGEIVLFGGATATNISSETWIWNGTTWMQRFPSASPPAMFEHAMAFDAAHGQVVLFGAIPGQTWIWDGTTWTEKFPASSPPVSQLHAMAYDSATAQVILFGGQPPLLATDTWAWDGNNWNDLGNSGPSPRIGPAMDYDAARSQVVMFGGNATFTSGINSETWLRNSSSVPIT